MRVLIVEDDPFHKQVMEAALRSQFPKVDIVSIATEKEFVKAYEAIASSDWNIAILDQMLPWTDEDDDDVFTGAPKEGPLRAGTRCYERLQADTRTAGIPVIFFTNLDNSAVPSGVAHLRKKADPNLKELMNRIQSLRTK